MITPDSEPFPRPTGVVGAPAPAVADVRIRDASREPAWVRLAPLALGALAAVLYLWNLDLSGYANTYYSAAAQAAGQSPSAWFFGSLDAASFITVDKPPVSLWAMGLSVRLLGISPIAVLLPEALAGVASVVLLYATVRRQLGPLAGVIAGVAFALTPVAVLMFRYNNPDAILTLLLVAAAWALVRGLEHGRIRWAVLAAVLVGFAFLTKYLQAYLVLPAFALTWLVAAPGSVGRRIGALAASAIAVAISSLWWVGIVEVVPASSRPFIGGSPTNSAIELLLGYDGLGRIFGGEGGAGAGRGPGPGGGGAFGGAPGLLRMFNAEWGAEVSWLLPGAAIGLVVGLIARARASRTDARRAAFLLWGTWAIVHVLVFSLMTGIAHPYYAVALAPAAAALFGGGIAELWRARTRMRAAGLVLGATLVITAGWALVLLDRTADFFPGAGLGALFVTIAAAIVLALSVAAGDRRGAALARGALVVGLGCVVVGPVLYAGATISKALAGGDPASGPNNGRFGPSDGFGAPMGGPFGPDVGADVIEFLVRNRGNATWLVAVTSANEAAPIQLDTGLPVMAMGGFSGSDPAPTLEQLQTYVRDGSLRFVLVGGPGRGFPGGFGGPGGGATDVARERTEWITDTCAPVSVGSRDTGLYDCAGAAG